LEDAAAQVLLGRTLLGVAYWDPRTDDDQLPDWDHTRDGQQVGTADDYQVPVALRWVRRARPATGRSGRIRAVVAACCGGRAGQWRLTVRRRDADAVQVACRCGDVARYVLDTGGPDGLQRSSDVGAGQG
jgi:hypothetical protein